MNDVLFLNVRNLFGHLDKQRSFEGSRHVRLRLGDASVDGAMDVVGTVKGTLDGVQTEFSVTATADLVCVRCLTRWSEELATEGSQHFSNIPDEDGYAVEEGMIDVGAPAMDELALMLPAAPVCKKDCKGLCPTCGTDLNSDPCDGHGEDSDSPFSVLKDLFDS